MTIPSASKLTKRERKQMRKYGHMTGDSDMSGFQPNDNLRPVKKISIVRNMECREIVPKNDRQHAVYDAFEEGQNLIMTGFPGTGKSFLALFLALTDIFDSSSDECSRYRKVVIVRSAVPSRDMGFMPGTEKEKMAMYEQPYISIVNDLFGRRDAYNLLTKQEIIEFTSTSFLRGNTIDNAIVIVDEFQNMTASELHTVVTRIGDNSRLILCGDIQQTDLTQEKSGFKTMMEIFSSIKSVSMINFLQEDIVRSGFVREYIIAKERVEGRGNTSKQTRATRT